MRGDEREAVRLTQEERNVGRPRLGRLGVAVVVCAWACVYLCDACGEATCGGARVRVYVCDACGEHESAVTEKAGEEKAVASFLPSFVCLLSLSAIT